MAPVAPVADGQSDDPVDLRSHEEPVQADVRRPAPVTATPRVVDEEPRRSPRSINVDDDDLDVPDFLK